MQGPATDDISGDARRYARLRYRLVVIDLAWSLAFLLVMQASRASGLLARWWAAHVSSRPAILLGYLVVFGAASYLWSLPGHVYGSFVLEHRFGLSRMSPGQWLVREAKRVALGAVFGAALIEGWYALLQASPRWWPVYATIGWVGVSIGLARIFPTWLLPMFYKSAPLEDQALVHRLLALCDRAKLAALGVFRIGLGTETRKANAALAGLGKSRRVLLSDTLLEQFSPDEIETVLAHELGHQRYHHIRRSLALASVGALLGFFCLQWSAGMWLPLIGVESLADVAAFPSLMIGLSLLGLLSLPLQSGISRRFEWQADHFAVELTRQPGAFASALRKLGQLNLADPNPPKWVEWIFYDHPPIAKRIQAAEQAMTA
ncbi:MAG: M48 family metallopeptidase [Candidatus Omnitrophica bacterium]|nr:M48 family metallopeptidase [Candidatus Omnitrophota bacterium]